MQHHHSARGLIRGALGALVVGCTLAGVASAQTYDVTVWTGTGTGAENDPTQQALPSNPLTGNTPVATFTYTGPVNWYIGAQDPNTLDKFVTGGTISGCNTALSGCATGSSLNPVVLSTSDFEATTLMELTFTTTGPVSGTVTHDDGESIWDSTNSTNYSNSSGPTSSVPTAFSLPSAGTYNLWYDEANGAPSQLTLQINSVPEPATMSLLGLGLAGLLVRRRRRAG